MVAGLRNDDLFPFNYSHKRLETKLSSCAWTVTVYVSVTRESCTLLCAYGLLAEQTGSLLSQNPFPQEKPSREARLSRLLY
jgi:hypothetical protein